MLRRRSRGIDARHVVRRAVSLVHGEVVSRVFVVHRHHDAIPGDLGDDARRRDARGGTVATDHRQRRCGQTGHLEAVGEHITRCHVEGGNRPAHAFDVGYVDADPVDLGGVDDHRAPAVRIAGDRAIQGFTCPFGESFGVIEIGQRGQLGRFEDTCRHHQRARTGPAAGLVDTGYRPQTVAVKRELEGAQRCGPADRGAWRPAGHRRLTAAGCPSRHRPSGRRDR